MKSETPMQDTVKDVGNSCLSCGETKKKAFFKMGAWGYNVDQNDMYMDTIRDFGELMEQGVSPEAAISSLYHTSWYSKYAESILAIVDLQIEHMGQLTKPVAIACEAILDNEMAERVLSQWMDPWKRENAVWNYKEKVSPYIEKALQSNNRRLK